MKFLPHLITSANLFCGVLAVVFLAEGQLTTAAYLVFAAGFLDFFDGLAARALGVSGEFGKQLDSLADVVTFGVVPAFMLFTLSQSLTEWPFNQSTPEWLAYVPLLIAIFSALRLAKFNIDSRQTTGFIGLPTPANAFWICGIPFLLQAYPELLTQGRVNAWWIALISGLSCYLLVSPIPMMSLKIKSLNIRENASHYLLVLSMVILVILFKFAALVALVPVYLLFSLIHKQNNTDEIHR